MNHSSGTRKTKGKNNSPLSLRHNFSWTLLSNVIYGVSQWATIIALTKIGTPELVGLYTLGIAITNPILLLANLNLRSVQVTDTKGEYNFNDYFTLRIWTSLTGVTLILCLSFSHFHVGTTGLIITLVGLNKSLEGVSDIFQGLLQQNERMDQVAWSVILRSLLSTFFVIGILYLTHNFILSLIGMILTNFFILFFYDITSVSNILTNRNIESSFQRSLKFSVNLAKLAKLAIYSLPVGILMMVLSLTLNIPRYFIEQYLGSRELGIFSAISYPAIAGITFITALGQSALPRLSRYYTENNRNLFQRLLVKMVGIGVILGTIGLASSILWGKVLLSTMYKPEYSEHSSVLLWLMGWIATLYVSTFLSYGVSAARYFKTSLVLSSILVIVMFWACLWLVPKYGMTGAAISLTIGGCVQLLGNFVIIRYIVSRLD